MRELLKAEKEKKIAINNIFSRMEKLTEKDIPHIVLQKDSKLGVCDRCGYEVTQITNPGHCGYCGGRLDWSEFK